MLSLSQIPVGCSARVISLNASRPVDQRLLAFGLLPGMLVKVTHLAPLGDPIAIEFQNQSISLRKAEAVEVMVELAPAPEAKGMRKEEKR